MCGRFVILTDSDYLQYFWGNNIIRSVSPPHPETRHLARIFSEEILFGRKKREEKEEIFEKLLLNFEICFGIKTN